MDTETLTDEAAGTTDKTGVETAVMDKTGAVVTEWNGMEDTGTVIADETGPGTGAGTGAGTDKSIGTPILELDGPQACVQLRAK